MESSEHPVREWLERFEGTPSNRIVAAIGYVPFLCFVPILARRDDQFARFHGKQSLVLLAALVGIWVLIWMADLVLAGVLAHIFIIGPIFKLLSWIIHYLLGGAVSLCYFAAVIAGILHALAGREWRIPFVSALAEELRI